jgi:hypothetical protein
MFFFKEIVNGWLSAGIKTPARHPHHFSLPSSKGGFSCALEVKDICYCPY